MPKTILPMNSVQSDNSMHITDSKAKSTSRPRSGSRMVLTAGVLLLLVVVSLTSSCRYPGNYPYGRDPRGYHFGQGHGYNGRYHGAHHRYNWQKHNSDYLYRNYHGSGSR